TVIFDSHIVVNGIFSQGILMFNITTPPNGTPSKIEGDCASAAAVRCGREHSSRTCFSPFFYMRNLN
ncbi:MAG: hypothetical protein K5901_07360, partial [Bacteroidales bacterium]|nr:hypothetical protein [Bacteroidales bacterium]